MVLKLQYFRIHVVSNLKVSILFEYVFNNVSSETNMIILFKSLLTILGRS